MAGPVARTPCSTTGWVLFPWGAVLRPHVWTRDWEGEGNVCFWHPRFGPPAFSVSVSMLSALCVWQVRDEQHQCSLGNLRIPLSQLLAREDMTLNQRFQLSNSGPNSSLKMKLALRVLSVRSGWGRGPGWTLSQRWTQGCVAQGSDDQGLCSDADGSSDPGCWAGQSPSSHFQMSPASLFFLILWSRKYCYLDQ